MRFHRNASASSRHLPGTLQRRSQTPECFSANDSKRTEWRESWKKLALFSPACFRRLRQRLVALKLRASAGPVAKSVAIGYDYIPLGDGRLAVVLADVSGKGMGAALLMSSTRSVLRLHAARGLSPRAVLSEVNRFLVEDMPASRFVTLIYAVVDPATRKITF